MKTYQKLDEGVLKEIETKTETREVVYKLSDLLLDEQNLLASLARVRDLIKEFEK